MLLTTTNNDAAQECLWDRSTTSGNPLGINHIVVDGNRVQSGTSHIMSQSERAPSGNNLTSAGTPLGINLSNGSPMLGNPTSTKQLEISKIGTQSNNHRNSHEKSFPTVQLELSIQHKGVYGTVPSLQILPRECALLIQTEAERSAAILA